MQQHHRAPTRWTNIGPQDSTNISVLDEYFNNNTTTTRKEMMDVSSHFNGTEGQDEGSPPQQYYICVASYRRSKTRSDPVTEERMRAEGEGSWNARKFNWLSSLNDYTHCEIAFPMNLASLYVRDQERAEAVDGIINRGGDSLDDYVYAYGVTVEEGVFGKPRTFSTPNYEFVGLKTDQAGFEAVINFCEDQVGKPMDNHGPIRSALWPKVSDGRKWYCAEFVIAALQQGGFVCGANPAVITIDEMMHAIKSDPSRINTQVRETPYIRRILREAFDPRNNNSTNFYRQQQDNNSQQQSQSNSILKRVQETADAIKPDNLITPVFIPRSSSSSSARKPSAPRTVMVGPHQMMA